MPRLARAVVVMVVMAIAVAPVVQAQTDARSADWLRTVRDTPLWSGADDPSVQFTLLPLGSFLQPRAGSDAGRLLRYFRGAPANGRHPGLAWVAAQDDAPSGPPPWIVGSELDGDHVVQNRSASAPTRALESGKAACT